MRTKNKLATWKPLVVFVGVFVLLFPVFCFMIFPVNANAEMPDTITEVPDNNHDTSTLKEIDEIEAEINKVEDEIMAQLSAELMAKPLTCEQSQAKQVAARELIKQETAKILESYGFKLADPKDGLTTETRSMSNNVQIYTPSLYYDSSSGLYRFSCDWNVEDGTNNGWDMFCDAEDFAGVRLTNYVNYDIYSSFCKTWNNFGYQTGYVDQYGQHSPTNSNCTKRTETAAGVAYNIIDEYLESGGLITYKTDSGRITQYVRKNPGASSSKLILDFHHNFKQYSWQLGAQISTVNFSGGQNALSVSYTHENGSWQRASGPAPIN